MGVDGRGGGRWGKGGRWVRRGGGGRGRGGGGLPATTSIRSRHRAVRPGRLLLLLLLLVPEASPGVSALCVASPSLACSEAEPSCSEGSPTTRGVGSAAVWEKTRGFGLLMGFVNGFKITFRFVNGGHYWNIQIGFTNSQKE